MVSVVRDYGMYGKCILDNPLCRSLSIVTLDNREENLPVPQRYNSFLDSIGEEDAWIVFCHEDWMPMEDIGPHLRNLDKGCIWGPVGAFIENCQHSDFIHICGRVRQCHKDGSHRKTISGTWPAPEADTLDCQCLIVHSSLIREKGLRFDANLPFDLYSEDLSAGAYLLGVPTRILPLKCMHWSNGVVGERFFSALEYLREKYRNTPKRFPTTAGRRNTFGGDQSKPVYNYRRRLHALLRYWIKK